MLPWEKAILGFLGVSRGTLREHAIKTTDCQRLRRASQMCFVFLLSNERMGAVPARGLTSNLGLFSPRGVPRGTLATNVNQEDGYIGRTDAGDARSLSN
jgi:hypothetical protein